MSEIKNSKFQIRLPLILFIGLSAGILIGATVADGQNGVKNVYSGVMRIKEILTHIEKNYVDEVDTDELVDEAITSMLHKLDPHTSYIPAEELKVVRAELQGNFEGIGIEFNIFKDTLSVVAPLSGGPSEQAGLMAGDKIVKVNGEDITGKTLTNRKVHDYLRGAKGTEVILSVKRKNNQELIDFKIIRDKIPQYSVDAAYMIDAEIGYIKVNRFTATTYDEFKEALNNLKEKGLQKLIIDLQDNPGGYMDRAINMADELLDGNRMIVYTEGKESRFNTEARAVRKGKFEDGPVIVLINEGSASASEIVAGAIQDNDRGLIVGRRSFGKGLVQMPINLTDGSELRLTISRYYTPSGRSIQRPYDTDDLDQYKSDRIARIQHGEFFHADSIRFNDSLRFDTVKGRTVYGGGGIMPDFFVPMDTSKNSAYLNRLFYTNTLREYAVNYVEKNKSRLEAMDYEDYRKNFEVTNAMLNELVNLGEENNVSKNEAQFERSKDLIALFAKAYIARSIWNGRGFYPIFNEQNEILQQALKLFGEAEALAKN